MGASGVDDGERSEDEDVVSVEKEGGARCGCAA